MEKLKLMLFPISVGIVLLFISWYTSYPVSIDSAYDFVYNHISPLYWAGLATLFASFFVVAMYTRNNILRWIVTVSTVLLMYSLPYFHYTLPASDANQFRGLTEYFTSTGDLTPTKPHSYYQWPLFFILNKMVPSMTGLDPRFFEFILFGITGFLLATALYLYTSRAQANGYIAVVAFFIINFYFFNYQWAPFSVSASLLVLLLVLDRYALRKREATLATLIIFFSMTLTHAFIPVFFIVYSFVKYVVNKNRRYLVLFLSTLAIYLVVSIYFATVFFPEAVHELTSLYTLEYSKVVEASLASAVAPRPYIDIIAQIFSRTVVITTAVITGLSFLILLVRRKLGKNEYPVLLTGVSYLAIGLVLPVLGTRALFMVIIPISLGASFLVESKFKRYFKSLFLILMILFTFAMIHEAFYDTQIFFQTRQEYRVATFMIENYNWSNPTRLLSDFRFLQYIGRRTGSESVVFADDFSPDFPQSIEGSGYVVYTIGIEKSFLRLNYPIERLLSESGNNSFDLIYSSGDVDNIFLRVKK